MGSTDAVCSLVEATPWSSVVMASRGRWRIGVSLFLDSRLDRIGSHGTADGEGEKNEEWRNEVALVMAKRTWQSGAASRSLAGRVRLPMARAAESFVRG